MNDYLTDIVESASNYAVSAVQYAETQKFHDFISTRRSTHRTLLSLLDDCRKKYRKQDRTKSVLDITTNNEKLHEAEKDRLERQQAEERQRLHSEMILDLGNLTRAIYDAERKLYNSTRNDSLKDSINTYVFEHTERYQLAPAFKSSSSNVQKQEINFVFRPNLHDKKSDPSSGKPDGQENIFAREAFAPNDETWLIGYDIETQSFDDYSYFDLSVGHTVTPPAITVSHQWYFNFQGVRFGVILLTKHRLYQDQFITYIKHALPEITEDNCEKMKLIRVYAYFSVYESGWLLPSYRDEQTEFTILNRQRQPAQLILERDDEWYGKVTLQAVEIPKIKKDGTYGKPTRKTVNLEFNDAIKLQAGGLKKLGEVIGISKQDLPPNSITQMANLLKSHPFTFNDYAITDSIIAAEAHLYIFYMQRKVVGGVIQKSRMPGYSVEYFKKRYMEHYPDIVTEPPKRWKRYLGYVNGEMTLTCKSFIEFYYGGRNDVLSVGPRDEAYYLDMHSAYLTSLTMLKDYDFSRSHTFTGSEAQVEADRLFDASLKENGNGPFQVVGVECSFVFKKEHTTEAWMDTGEKVQVEREVKPVFPVRINDSAELPAAYVDFASDGIIYPRCGSTCVTWPEYWVARRMDLLESHHVYRVITFDEVEADNGKSTNWLAEDILSMLVKRKKADDTKDKAVVAFIKNFLNFIYGKSVQGIAETSIALKKHDAKRRIDVSDITSYPLGSYITGFCRSVIAELIQLNPCYGVTTDGFITPTPRKDLIVRELCARVQQRLSNAGFDEPPNKKKKFIGEEYKATKSLFLKTRGYMFIDETQPEKDDREFSPKTMLKKLARMGGPNGDITDSDPAKSFLEYLQAGYTDKKYLLKLKAVRKGQRKSLDVVPSAKRAEDTAITMTFDMKHVPVEPAIAVFDWSGNQYEFISFETKPLETTKDFHNLRILIERDTALDVEKYDTSNLDTTSLPHSNDLEETARMRDYWKSAGIDSDKFDTIPYTLDRDGNRRFTEKAIEPISKKRRLFFSHKADKARLARLLTDMREIPRYMELADYKRLLEDFSRYRDGK